MKVNYKYLDYVRYWPGNSRVHVIIDAPHCAGTPDESDEKTLELSHDLAEVTGAGVIQSLIPRSLADLNRDIDFNNAASVQAHAQQRKALCQILRHKNAINGAKKVTSCFLYISLHGMKNYFSADLVPIDIELGTRWGALCDEDTAQYLKAILDNSGAYNILLDNKFVGTRSLYWHINGDPRVPAYKGYGRNLKVVQVELSHDLRFNYYSTTLKALAVAIASIQQNLFKSNKNRQYAMIN
ncbi:hypothetical protein [Solidesulfovibrio alcoholivorans]|uniref:hypothetical protein n=1 Tax=Solidesulfovibrio alcoholivorans TaxID=81406 RepID=UPI0012EC2567|nr:hypothetical protein [Solidesulfovibrio alcoholivorans]